MTIESGITTEYRIRARLGRAATAGLLAFAAILLAEHLLDHSLNPLRHQVSEYVHASTGLLMVLGFLMWAFSLIATGLLVRLTQAGRFVAVLLILAGAGMVLVAAFPTETTAGELPPGTAVSATGRLHDLGSGLTALALLAAAICTALSPRCERRLRRWSAAFAGAAITIGVTLLLVGPEVGGLRQRLVLLAGCCWQLLLLTELRRPGYRVKAGTVR